MFLTSLVVLSLGFYGAISELAKLKMNDGLFGLLFLGSFIYLVLFAPTSTEGSIYYALIFAIVLYLPFFPFYRKELHFLFFQCLCAIWLGLKIYLYFYTYMVLVCSLLSLLMLVYHKRFSKAFQGSPKKFFSFKKNEGNSGIEAPYYLSSAISLIGVLFIYGR